MLEVLHIENISRSLERLADLLAKIQKALGEYLERQRSAFPRFYFVGDEDLLEIIGNSKDLYINPLDIALSCPCTNHNLIIFLV